TEHHHIRGKPDEAYRWVNIDLQCRPGTICLIKVSHHNIDITPKIARYSDLIKQIFRRWVLASRREHIRHFLAVPTHFYRHLIKDYIVLAPDLHLVCCKFEIIAKNSF